MKPADYCQFEHFLHHSRVGGCDKCRTRLAFSSHLLLCIGVALLPNVTNISKYWTQPTQSQESVPSDQGVLSDLSVYFLQTCLLILNSNPTLPPPQKKTIYIRNQARFYRIDIPTRRHKPYDPSFISESPKVFPLSMQNIKRFAMQCRDWVLLSSPVGFCPHGLSHNILVYNLCLYPRSRGNHSSDLMSHTSWWRYTLRPRQGHTKKNRQGLQADQRFSSKPTDHPSLIESRPKNLAQTQTIRLPFVCVCGAGIRGKRFPQKGCKEDCLLQTESIHL